MQSCADAGSWVFRHMQPFGITLLVDGGVEMSPGLRSWPLIDSGGVRVGTVHGVLLREWAGPGVTVGDDAVRTDFPVATSEDFEERLFPGLSGLFVAVTGAPLPRRLYVDNGAQIPMVWCTRSGRAGSSPTRILSPAEQRDRFDRARWHRLVEREGHGWISGTLTAYQDVRRLLPGHWLDLDRLETGRFWPREDRLGPPLGLAEGAAQAADAVKGMVEAVVRQYRTAISITAGFDSRMLVAASRDVCTRAGYYTVPIDAVDAWQAPRIARALGLSHRLVPVVPSTPADQQWWDEAVGYSVREKNRDFFRTLGQLDAEVIVNGAFGEPGRARLYRRDAATINRRRIDPALLLSRLTVPKTAEHLAEMEAWLAPVQWLPSSAILDLAYIELRGASWAMAQAPAQKAIRWSFAPFAQRAVFDAFLRVPPEVKGTRRLFEAMVLHLWPELMQFPINRFGDYRDRLGPFARIDRLVRREKLVRFLRERIVRTAG